MDENIIIETYNKGINAVITLVTNLHTEITTLNITVATLNDEVLNVRTENLLLLNRLNELEARVKKNSSNSSKPPSSDGYKKAPINSREKSGKPTGGQFGHTGKTLKKVAKPDNTIEYKISPTCDCGCNLDNVKGETRTRQEFDIPKIRMYVTEHITCKKVCPTCGKIHETDFPSKITQPTQYGENMNILLTYLTQYQLIPLSRAVEAVNDITGQNISQGTIVNAAERLYEQLKDAVGDIKKKIIKSDVAHFDETGMRSEGKTKWMHVASTPTLTYYETHDKRGTEAAKSIGIIENFSGTAVHDHWKPYYSFENCTHSECNSHHLRYLKDVLENYKQDWAATMIRLLIESHREVEALKAEGKEEMPKEKVQDWQDQYHKIIEKGIREDDEKSPVKLNKKGKRIKSKPLQLLIRMREYDIETLAFIHDFSIPFDNNLAERDIRMQKLRQKISGCFRGKNGVKVFCRIRSYISTARKNGLSAMDAISMAVKGNPFIPES